VPISPENTEVLAGWLITENIKELPDIRTLCQIVRERERK
jgi:hypothetical protein